MRHGWEEHLSNVADEFGGTLEDRGDKFVIHLPNGASVWCSKTPSKESRDRVRSECRRRAAQPRRAHA